MSLARPRRRLNTSQRKVAASGTFTPLVSIVLAQLASLSLAERVHGLFEAQPLPSTCHDGVLQLDGRYKTLEVIEYKNSCTLRGAPGTEVEVLGEIHFLQNALLEGSLRFRKARVGEVPSDHRCVDVEGSLEFVDPDVEFINCGSTETDDGGGLYVEGNLTLRSGRVVVRNGTASWGGGVFVGDTFLMTGGSLHFEDCVARESGGAFFIRTGNYLQLGSSSVTIQRSSAGQQGGGINLESGKFNLSAGRLFIEDCAAGNSGGGIAAVNFEKGQRGQVNVFPDGVLEGKNCSIPQFKGQGGFVASHFGMIAGKLEVDGCYGGSACVSIKKDLKITATAKVTMRNCEAESATGFGGALYTSDTRSKMTVEGQVDVTNSSAGTGGAINAQGKLTFLAPCRVRLKNVSASHSGGAIWAKAMYQEGGELHFSHCRSERKGGAISVYATLHQRGSHSKMTFRSCWSYLGGAIFGLALESTGDMSFDDCSSENLGGAVFAVAAVKQVASNATMAFHDCHSNKSGGGIYAARLEQQGKMSFKKCTARRSGGAASITDVIHTDLLKGRKTTKLRTWMTAYIAQMGNRGSVQLNGTSEFRNCVAGAGGALFARGDLNLAKNAKATFQDGKADAFGGALHGRDMQLLGDAFFRNITALAGGIIQSTGTVKVPGAVMQETGAPQISALKLIQVSNVSVTNTSHVWFVAPEIHLSDVHCDNGLASFKEEHHVGCRTCEENKIQVSGSPVLDDGTPEMHCLPAPRGTAEIDNYHITLKKGWMTEKANISRSFRCPNRLACFGGTVSTSGWSAMCSEGYEGRGCTKCTSEFGPLDSNGLVCVPCATQLWRQNLQTARYVLQDLLIFGLSLMGISSGATKDSKILTNHFMSFVAAAGPVLQAVQETPTFKRLMQHGDAYVEGFSDVMEAGESSGSSNSGISSSCILSYWNLPRFWWTRAICMLVVPFLAMVSLSLLRGWRIAVVVGVNCFLAKGCLSFARFLVCYRMEPEHEGGQLSCFYDKFADFNIATLLALVMSIAIAGPLSWWLLLADEASKQAPFYVYLTDSYKEELKRWEVTRLVRKAALAIICAALPISLHPAMQIMCISLVLLTALVLEMQFHPYKDNRWNQEEKVLLITSLAMVSITSCYLANEYHWSSTHRNQCFLLTLIVLLCVVPSNILIILILLQLWAEKKGS